MNLDFLSGLLLTAAVLATAGFVVKELLDSRPFGEKKIRPRLSHFLEMLSGKKSEPVNNRLIGSIGEVIAHSGDSARPMMVRVHPELWPARQNSTTEAVLPVGTTVKIAAVDGPVLVVVATNELGESPDVA